MKFYEVGPNLLMTQHAITIRPIAFSGKTFKKLPPDLQAAIVKAGKEAGAYGRQVESSEDTAKLDAIEKAGRLKRIPFADRDAMKKAVDPVMADYAKEIGAEAIYARSTACSKADATSGGGESSAGIFLPARRRCGGDGREGEAPCASSSTATTGCSTCCWW